MQFRNKSDAVRAAAKGRWLEIFANLAPDLKDAINALPNHVKCPVHGGTDGFRLFKDAKETGGGISNQDGAMPDGFSLLMWYGNDTFATVLKDVAEYLGLENWKQETNVQPKQAARSAHYDDAECHIADEAVLTKRRHHLREVWKHAIPLWHPNAQLARTYLASRGLDVSRLNLEGLSKTMRFHRHLALWQKDKFLGYFPALVTLVTYDTGEQATIHRTFLDHDGLKLKEVNGVKVMSKKLMSRCKNKRLTGSAIRFGQPKNGVLNVCEGIETALSVMLAKNEAVWPCVSSTILATFEPPQDVDVINIWADKDREKNNKCAGYEAAVKLFERMEKKGVLVNILLPTDPIPQSASSVDWNDVLIQHGVQRFPNTRQLMWQ